MKKFFFENISYTFIEQENVDLLEMTMRQEKQNDESMLKIIKIINLSESQESECLNFYSKYKFDLKVNFMRL